MHEHVHHDDEFEVGDVDRGEPFVTAEPGHRHLERQVDEYSVDEADKDNDGRHHKELMTGRRRHEDHLIAVFVNRRYFTAVRSGGPNIPNGFPTGRPSSSLRMVDRLALVTLVRLKTVAFEVLACDADVVRHNRRRVIEVRGQIQEKSVADEVGVRLREVIAHHSVRSLDLQHGCGDRTGKHVDESRDW